MELPESQSQTALSDAGQALAQKGPLLAQEKVQQISSFASKNFGGVWKFLFFVGAASVTASGILGIVEGIGAMLSPFSMCNQFFLTIFGVIMMIIDFPYQSRAIVELRLSVFKYFLFMTRFTGRGLWYLFLATMVWASLYNLDLEPLLGFFLAIGVGVLGVLAMGYGVQKSLKLESCRKNIVMQLMNRPPSDLCPPTGLRIPEFNALCESSSGISFNNEELHYIARALSYQVRADDIISQEEFRAWIHGRTTIL